MATLTNIHSSPRDMIYLQADPAGSSSGAIPPAPAEPATKLTKEKGTGSLGLSVSALTVEEGGHAAWGLPLIVGGKFSNYWRLPSAYDKFKPGLFITYNGSTSFNQHKTPRIRESYLDGKTTLEGQFSPSYIEDWRSFITINQGLTWGYPFNPEYGTCLDNAFSAEEPCTEFPNKYNDTISGRTGLTWRYFSKHLTEINPTEPTLSFTGNFNWTNESITGLDLGAAWFTGFQSKFFFFNPTFDFNYTPNTVALEDDLFTFKPAAAFTIRENRKNPDADRVLSALRIEASGEFNVDAIQDLDQGNADNNGFTASLTQGIEFKNKGDDYTPPAIRDVASDFEEMDLRLRFFGGYSRGNFLSTAEGYYDSAFHAQEDCDSQIWEDNLCVGGEGGDYSLTPVTGEIAKIGFELALGSTLSEIFPERLGNASPEQKTKNFLSNLTVEVGCSQTWDFTRQFGNGVEGADTGWQNSSNFACNAKTGFRF